MAVIAGWTAAQALPLHAHVSEQKAEQEQCLAVLAQTPLAVLAEAGALDPHFTAVHGTHFSGADIALLARTGGRCCACPTTERDLGDGVGPFRELHREGVGLCIGSDSHAVVDGFEEVRAIEMEERLRSQSRGIFAAADLLCVATAGGMRSLAWDSGILEAGHLADFITVRLDSVRTAGSDPARPAAALFSASAADVATVVVGGRVLVEDGCHVAVPDAARRLSECVAGLLR
jgi:cytosine/adenosine deaminase-related metal-dependent hydrolase